MATMLNEQKFKRATDRSRAGVEALRMTESTLFLSWVGMVGVQSRLLVARREADSSVVATELRTAHALVFARTPTTVVVTRRRTRGVGRHCHDRTTTSERQRRSIQRMERRCMLAACLETEFYLAGYLCSFVFVYDNTKSN